MGASGPRRLKLYMAWGQTLNLKAWSKLTGVPRETLKQRIEVERMKPEQAIPNPKEQVGG